MSLPLGFCFVSLPYFFLLFIWTGNEYPEVTIFWAKGRERRRKHEKIIIRWRPGLQPGYQRSGSLDFTFSISGEEESGKKNHDNNQEVAVLLLRVELKTSRLLNGCSNQLSYKSISYCAWICSVSHCCFSYWLWLKCFLDSPECLFLFQ